MSQQLDKHAVVFMKDVRYTDLKALVDFMYKGEVNISQYQLESFLQTAEALQIKGIQQLIHSNILKEFYNYVYLTDYRIRKM